MRLVGSEKEEEKEKKRTKKKEEKKKFLDFQAKKVELERNTSVD